LGTLVCQPPGKMSFATAEIDNPKVAHIARNIEQRIDVRP
jgi:hypothetical protein